ncbi:MAG: DnaA regulatory inactivator Hda [Algicola sp.]|nr:DnaA regulatory inactivator Hda [Algicola sp.]
MQDSKPMQLALPVTLPDDEVFASFYHGENRQLVEHLNEVLGKTERQFSFTFLSGTNQSGKSHLLYASCVEAQELGLTNILLPLDQLIQMKPQVLDGIDSYDLICVDNFELIGGNDAWEKAFFYLFNLLDAAGKTLIVAAKGLPDTLNIKLPDLISRLNWGVTYQLKYLNDADKVKALQVRAKLRGLELSLEAGRYMVSRLTRDITSLIDALDQLDKASIALQRKLTIPFIKDTLSL